VKGTGEVGGGGLSREDAYALVQAAAMRTWDTGTPFRDTLSDEAKSRGITLDDAAIDQAFRPERYVERLSPVFERLSSLT
jgi:adenylosuccinate lyase